MSENLCFAKRFLRRVSHNNVLFLNISENWKRALEYDTFSRVISARRRRENAAICRTDRIRSTSSRYRQHHSRVLTLPSVESSLSWCNPRRRSRGGRDEGERGRVAIAPSDNFPSIATMSHRASGEWSLNESNNNRPISVKCQYISILKKKEKKEK